MHIKYSAIKRAWQSCGSEVCARMSTRRLLGPLSAPLYSTERSYRSKLDLKGIATAPFRDLDTGETLLLKTDGFVAVFKYAWNGVLPLDLPDAKELRVRLNQLVDEIYAKGDDALLLSDQQYVMSCTVAADEESGLLVSCGIRRMPDVKAVLDALYMYAKRNKVPAGRGIKRAGGTHELPGWMRYDIEERCMRELSAVTEPVFERSDDSGQVVERKRASAEPPRLRACAALFSALLCVRRAQKAGGRASGQVRSPPRLHACAALVGALLCVRRAQKAGGRASAALIGTLLCVQRRPGTQSRRTCWVWIFSTETTGAGWRTLCMRRALTHAASLSSGRRTCWRCERARQPTGERPPCCMCRCGCCRAARLRPRTPITKLRRWGRNQGQKIRLARFPWGNLA